MVVDAFTDRADPESDIRDLTEDMILADQSIVENNLQNKDRKMRLTGDKSVQAELDLLNRCLETLEKGNALIHMEAAPDEERTLRNYQFLSRKPILVVLNIAEDDLRERDSICNRYAHVIQTGKRELATLCGKIQMELAMLSPDEQGAFLSELGLTDVAMRTVIEKSYTLMGLISFLTTSRTEVRAWTIKKGTVALKAAGVVHSDMERGFIRAEVTPYEDFAELRTAAALKAAGRLRLEGKDYVVQDGDVILFRFNV